LLLDEFDAALNGPKEYVEILRGLLDDGDWIGGIRSLLVQNGKDWRDQDLSIYCPKAFGGIGAVSGTVADRGLQIRLLRKTKNDKISRLRHRRVKPEADELRKRAAEWTKQQVEALKDADPDMPESLNDRQQDHCEVLCAIADLLGKEWAKKVRDALVEMCGSVDAEDTSPRVQMLADIACIFGRRLTEAQAIKDPHDQEQAMKRWDKIASADLMKELLAVETSNWSEYRKGKPITQNTVAKLLKPYRIYPGTKRIDEDRTLKGYQLNDFEDAWHRFLPDGMPESLKRSQ
jgi:putative DNA primase/helicase